MVEQDYPDYEVDVKVCVYSAHEVVNAQAEFDQYFKYTTGLML